MRQQRIGHKPFASPADTVRWFGAVQAQDYLGSLWAIGLRTRAATEASLERAIAERSIVRTWPLRDEQRAPLLQVEQREGRGRCAERR
jgi:hypothetical protein